MSYNLRNDIKSIIDNSSIDFTVDLNDMIVFYINNKTIEYLNEEDKVKDLIVKGYSQSRKFCFVCQRFIENMDMSETYPVAIFSNGKNKYFSSKYDPYDRTETRFFSNWIGLKTGLEKEDNEEFETEQFIYFIWTIPAEFAAVSGINLLSIMLKTDEDYRFVTKNLEIPVADALDYDGEIIIPTIADTERIDAVEQRIIDLEKSDAGKQSLLTPGYGISIFEDADNNNRLTIGINKNADSSFYKDYLEHYDSIKTFYQDYTNVIAYYSKEGLEPNLLEILKSFERLIRVSNVAEGVNLPNYDGTGVQF